MIKVLGKRLEDYRATIPVGKENAATYEDLSRWWGMSKRRVREKLHEIALQRPTDGYILIRSSNSKGFYRTDDLDEIKRYNREIVNRSRNVLEPSLIIRQYLRSKEV